MAESFSTIIFQELRAKYPDIDWTLGSTVRELVAEPIAEIGDTAVQRMNEAESRMDILQLLNNPTLYADAINELATKLGITTPSPTAATGTVKVLMDTVPELLVIAAGTQFTWNNVRLTATQETRWSYGSSLADGVQPLKYLGPSSYQAEVPVESNETGELALFTGSAVNWTNAPGYVYDCRIGSPVTGGRISYTLVEKAELIRDILFPPSYSGETGIKNSLRRQLPLIVRDASVAKKATNIPGTVTLFVQTIAAPEQWEVTGTSKSVNGSVMIALTIPGAYSIVQVYNSLGGVIDFTYKTTDGVFTVTLPSVTEQGEIYTIRCEGLKDYSSIMELLNREQKNTPYRFSLSLPIIAAVGLELTLSSNYEVLPTSPAIIALQNYISSLPLNTYLLDDVTLERFLAPYGISLAESTIYTAELISEPLQRKRVSSGSMNLQDIVYTSSRPVVMYCYSSGVTITNV